VLDCFQSYAVAVYFTLQLHNFIFYFGIAFSFIVWQMFEDKLSAKRVRKKKIRKVTSVL
jgi:hypothetical protein